MKEPTIEELRKKYKEQSFPGIRAEVQDLIMQHITDDEIRQLLAFEESGDLGLSVNMLFSIANRLFEADMKAQLRQEFNRRYIGLSESRRKYILHRITDKELLELFVFHSKGDTNGQKELLQKVMDRPWLN